ncbi:MAG: hypothetical protein H0T71_14555 [Acidobacteria bacterium]|nr:hypothetical protein [Acidobacteriota bacterium]
MTDDELRVLVRDAISRHLGGTPQLPSPAGASSALSPAPMWRAHPSFGKFLVSPGDDDGGSCMIEPSVRCNHCGFCQSYGY